MHEPLPLSPLSPQTAFDGPIHTLLMNLRWFNGVVADIPSLSKVVANFPKLELLRICELWANCATCSTLPLFCSALYY